MLIHYGWDLPGPRSGWYTVKCGAHKDSHASCRINQELNAVKCMSCDFGGDIIKVVKHYEGDSVDFRTLVSIAAGITGASGGTVRGSSRAGNAVPRGARDNRSDRAYTPPRKRSS